VELEWKARKNKDWGTVWDLTTTAYQEKISRASFITDCNVEIDEYTITRITVLEPEARAMAEIDTVVTFITFKFDHTYKEEWLFENGEWRLNLLPTSRLPWENEPQ
jgi:hypothetical protein